MLRYENVSIKFNKAKNNNNKKNTQVSPRPSENSILIVEKKGEIIHLNKTK